METITATSTAQPLNLFRSLVESRNNTVWNSKNLGQIYLFRVTHLRGKSKVLYDEFYKIGYSGYQDLSSRICYMPTCYLVEVIDTAIFDRAEARRLEGLIHKYFKRYSHKPRHRFDGSTECYSLDMSERYPSIKELLAGVKLNTEIDMTNLKHLN